MTIDPRTTADLTYEQYDKSRPILPEIDIPESDLRDVNTITEQSVSDFPPEIDLPTEPSEDFYEDELEDIPDADDIHKDSPVDPVALPIEVGHGTDLINGYHNNDPEY
ncbi:hypothetical protein [Paenibacillus sp. CMAA1364]